MRSPPAPSPCTSWRRHGHGWVAKLKRCPVHFLLGPLSPSVSCSARVATPGRLLVTALSGKEGEPSLLGGLRGPCPQRIAQPGMLCRRSASPEWSRCRAARGTSEQTCLCPSKALRCVRQPPAQRQRKQLGRGGRLEEGAEPPTPRRPDRAGPQALHTRQDQPWAPVQDLGVRGHPVPKPWSSLRGLHAGSHPATGSPRHCSAAVKYRRPLSTWLRALGLCAARAGTAAALPLCEDPGPAALWGEGVKTSSC